jgi:hypothetical protein
LITTIGDEAQDGTIIRTVEWHDRTTRAKDAVPLA